MKKIITATALSLLLMASPALAAGVGVGAYYWMPEFNADFAAEGDILPGTQLNLDDDLGMEDEDFVVVEAQADIFSHHIFVSAVQVDYEGTATLSRDIEFADMVFSASEDILTTLEYTMLDVGYQYDILDFENWVAGFSLGLGVQLKYIEGEATIESRTTGMSEDESFEVPLPLISMGLHVGIVADLLEVNVRAAGIKYDDNYVLDARGELLFTPFPLLAIGAGYRHVEVEVEVQDVDFRVQQTGPYATLQLSF